jgi:ribonuclease HI
MKKVLIYTDGACSKNPGPGGWGVMMMYKDAKKELSGFVEETTNNRMELQAVLMGLMALKEPCNVEIYTDSAYVHNAFDKGWIYAWQNNGWKTASKSPVENQDLWKEIINYTKGHKVKWIKVAGHKDNEFNNRCDELARGEIKKHTKKSKSRPAAASKEGETAGKKGPE